MGTLEANLLLILIIFGCLFLAYKVNKLSDEYKKFLNELKKKESV